MKITSFDFWQKFGKALLVVVAVMPAAGLMISIGKLIGMSAGDVNAVHTIARVMEDIGWAIITNLHILFAVAIVILGERSRGWCICSAISIRLNKPNYRSYIWRKR